MACNLLHNKTVYFKVENLAQLTLRFSPLSFYALYKYLRGTTIEIRIEKRAVTKRHFSLA
jgi:hypothetical protein